MALYQYKLTILPKQGILKRLGTIPEILKIDFEAWDNYWEKSRLQNPDAEPDFEDAFTIPWWENVTVDLKKIEDTIDQLLPKASYSKPDSLQWKCEEEYNDHDVWIGNNLIEISQFYFRIDLRDSQGKFLKGMIAIAEELDAVLMDENGKLFSPSLEKIIDGICHSDAAQFLENPKKFFDDYIKNNE